MEARRQAYDTLEMREFRRHDCQIYVQRAVLLTARLPGRRRATAHNWALCIMAGTCRIGSVVGIDPLRPVANGGFGVTNAVTLIAAIAWGGQLDRKMTMVGTPNQTGNLIPT